MSALEGRHAFVTGGSRGIGLACVRALLQAGAKVTLTGRDEKRLDEEVRGLGAGDRARGCVMDVRDAGEISAAFSRASEAFGEVSVLVNNAGIAPSAPFAKTDLALWNEVLATDLTGAFLCTREVLPAMQKAKWGRVVNVASTASLKGYPYVSAYCAAKHGLLGLTRALAVEVAASGVTVNAVCPGFADTDIVAESAKRVAEKTGRAVESVRAQLVAGNPQGRLVKPDEVAALVCFLCGEDAAAINGAALPVAGGEVG